MNTAERRDSLLRAIRHRGYLNVGEAADELAVDTSTVRRDLARLEGLGLIERSHGGAIPVRDEAEVPLDLKLGRQVEEKRALAAGVAELIPDGSTILLDSGSTCLMVARALSQHHGLTVITPDIRIAAVLTMRDDVRLIVPGGETVPDTSTLISQEGMDLVRRLHVDVAVLGVDAVDAQGASNLNSVVVPYKRAILSVSTLKILAVDSTKLDTRRLVSVLTLDEVDVLVTDEGADPDLLVDYPVRVVRAPRVPQEAGR